MSACDLLLRQNPESNRNDWICQSTCATEYDGPLVKEDSRLSCFLMLIGSYINQPWNGRCIPNKIVTTVFSKCTKNFTLVRGIKTFLGTGSPVEAAYSCAAKSFACVKRVPSTKRANQNGWGKSFSRWIPDWKYNTATLKWDNEDTTKAGTLTPIPLDFSLCRILVRQNEMSDTHRDEVGKEVRLQHSWSSTTRDQPRNS